MGENTHTKAGTLPPKQPETPGTPTTGNPQGERTTTVVQPWTGSSHPVKHTYLGEWGAHKITHPWKHPHPRKGNRRPTGSPKHRCKVTRHRWTLRWGTLWSTLEIQSKVVMCQQRALPREEIHSQLLAKSPQRVSETPPYSRAHRPTQSITLHLGLTPEKTSTQATPQARRCFRNF